jgi:hypothetical protein
VTCVDHKTGHDDPRTKQNMFRQLLAAVVSWRLGLMSGDAVMDWLNMIEPVFFLKRRDSILLSTKTLIKASPVKLPANISRYISCEKQLINANL